MKEVQCIRRITDSRFYGGKAEYLEKVSRHAARGVLFNEERLVAMMEMPKKLYLYKLPGGGIEKGEKREEALLRELREETGCRAVIIHELGYVDEHKNRNGFLQRSYGYIAEAPGLPGSVSLTDHEKRLGMRTSWMRLGEAIRRMKESVGRCKEYSARFMIERDLILLEAADRWLAKENGVRALSEDKLAGRLNGSA